MTASQIFVYLVALLPTEFRDGPACQVSKVVAGVMEAEDQYGGAVAIDGDIVVVGADMFGSTGFGYAKVYRRTGTEWVHEQTLHQPMPAFGDYFARHLDVHDGTIMVGCVNCGAGKVYVFQRKGGLWSVVQELVSPDSGSGFGLGVAINGEVAIVGAPAYDNASGAAYVFRFDGTSWAYEDKLVPPDPAPENSFGHAVDISGDFAVVGPANDSEAGHLAGAVYVFRFHGTSWAHEQKLFSPTPGAWEHFGRQLAISGDWILVGNSIDLTPPYLGRAQVFGYEAGSWSHRQTLVGDDTSERDGFGSAVALDGQVMVLTAGGDDAADPSDLFCNSGAAYVFECSGETWSQTAKVIAADVSCGDFLGYGDPRCAAVDEQWAVIGAPYSDDACPSDPYCNSGSAYVFAIIGDCNRNNIVDACEIQAGSVEDTDDDLIPDECPAMSFPGVISMLAALGTAGGVILSTRSRRLDSAMS